MYFITIKRMLEVCFSAHPNIQYRAEFSITQKGANVLMMRTHTKQKHVASDRTRRPNVLWHIRCPSPSYNQEQYNSISK